MRHVLVRCSVLAALITGVSLAWAFSNGPPASRTGARAFSSPQYNAETNCTACHSGQPLNDPNGLVEILDLPSAYTPGNTYPLRVRLSYALADTVGDSNPKWGFEFTAIRADSGNRAGTLIVPSGAPLVIKVPTGGALLPTGRQYIMHTSAGTFTNAGGPVEWSFDWKAPDTAQGTILFFVAGNAADGDLGTTGDHIFLAADSIDAAANGGVPLPWHASTLRLDAPRPNPSYQGSTLSYALERPGRINLSVFDASGRLIRTLVDGDQPAGAAQARWNATDERGVHVPTGTYFARLTQGAGRDQVTRKITIAR